jgi:hypothetical protein
MAVVECCAGLLSGRIETHPGVLGHTNGAASFGFAVTALHDGEGKANTGLKLQLEAVEVIDILNLLPETAVYLIMESCRAASRKWPGSHPFLVDF